METGRRIRNSTPIVLKTTPDTDWEWVSKGVMRNVFTNGLKGGPQVVPGEVFAPGSLEGVVGEQDELDGTWSVQWHHPDGHPISSSQIEGSTWYSLG